LADDHDQSVSGDSWSFSLVHNSHRRRNTDLNRRRRSKFDCNTNKHPNEQLICQSTELSELDNRMTALYHNVLNYLNRSDQEELTQSQRRWLKERLSCNYDFYCTKRAYTDRIQRLSVGWGQPSLSAPLKPPPMAAPVARTVAPPQQQQTSFGTGFFVTGEGHIITNAHVAKGCRYVSSSRGGQITRLAFDEASDLALYISSEKPSYWASLRGGRGPRPGETVIAMGFPLKGLLSSDPIVTTGIISALAGIRERRKLQQW
jgi:S1-C subfamily serine protease